MSDAKAGDPPDGSRALEMSYVNYRGEIRQRFVTPLGPIYWGSNEWHTDEQWLFDVYDHERRGGRTFALRGVLGVMRTTAVVNGQVGGD